MESSRIVRMARPKVRQQSAIVLLLVAFKAVMLLLRLQLPNTCCTYSSGTPSRLSRSSSRSWRHLRLSSRELLRHTSKIDSIEPRKRKYLKPN